MTTSIIHVIEIPARKERGNWAEAIFEEIMVINFLQ